MSITLVSLGVCIRTTPLFTGLIVERLVRAEDACDAPLSRGLRTDVESYKRKLESAARANDRRASPGKGANTPGARNA